MAVLEASARSCGTEFHAEVGKFKFLNEMIKLVSPKYLGPRTPEHVKKKVRCIHRWNLVEIDGARRSLTSQASLW